MGRILQTALAAVRQQDDARALAADQALFDSVGRAPAGPALSTTAEAAAVVARLADQAARVGEAVEKFAPGHPAAAKARELAAMLVELHGALA